MEIQEERMINRTLYYAAAAATAIAGILHLMLVPKIRERNPNSGVFLSFLE